MEAVLTKYQLLQPLMTERLRRQWAACEAQSLGRGGVSLVAEATGLSRTTITAGRRELQQRDDLSPERVRAPGEAGISSSRTTRPSSLRLQTLIESSTRGIRNRPCAGPLRAHGQWLRNCARRVMW